MLFKNNYKLFSLSSVLYLELINKNTLQCTSLYLHLIKNKQDDVEYKYSNVQRRN